ncbi:MAG: hypothetical protein JWQ35_1447 [Bacteriovoracaceae bacterium]|nr:hypothetical protein [Bacteriovoracaceae bacterium]
MLWVKALHIVFMVSWMAGLLYLPRLFVYHAMCEDQVGRERFKIMERRLYYGIMHPALLFTLATGLWMILNYAWQAYGNSFWLLTKLSLVFLLIIYHFFCGLWLRDFKNDKNKHTHKFYRWMNELPFVILLIVTILVVVKPFQAG